MKCKVQWKILLAILTLMSGKMSAQRTEAFGQYRKTQDSQIEQLLRQQYQEVSPWFEEAYRDYPTLPRGVLEAVAFQYTRFDPNVRMDTLEADPSEILDTYPIPEAFRVYKKFIFKI